MNTDAMQVECHHHIDASEPDAEGFYDYYYEYDIYRFTQAGLTLIVRSYSDTAQQASVMGLEEAGKTGKSRALQFKDLKKPLVQQALAYLQNEGKQELRWFNPRYGRYDPV